MSSPLADRRDADCVFCAIAAGTAPAAIVHDDGTTLAFIDLRQAQPGHVLVVPRAHLHDVRELDPATGAALMASLARITRAVAAAFPHDGLHVWHSIGEAAGQEVPHLHFHVHPRRHGDGLVRIYPDLPADRAADELEAIARRVRAALQQEPGTR